MKVAQCLCWFALCVSRDVEIKRSEGDAGGKVK